jgi:hypothetical protein
VSAVDVLADAIGRVSLAPSATGSTYHLVSASTPLRWADFADAATAAGHRVRAVGWVRWGRALKRLMAREGAAATVLHKGNVGLMPDARTLWRYFRERNRVVEYDAANADAALAASGFQPQPIDAAAIATWLRGLEADGILPAPVGAR